MATRQETKRSRVLARQGIANWTGDPVGTKIARRIIHLLIDQVREKDWIALRAIVDLAYHGLVQVVESELRSEKFKARVKVNGQVVNATIAARISRPVRARTGLRTRERQYPLWLDEEWDVIESLRSGARSSQREAMVREAVFGGFLDMRPLYPTARTPRELMTLANIDLDSVRPLLAAGGDGDA